MGLGLRTVAASLRGELLLAIGGALFVCRHLLTFWTSSSDASPIASFGTSVSWLVAVACSVVSCLVLLVAERRREGPRLSWYAVGFGLLAVALVTGALAGWSGHGALSWTATVLLGLGNGVAFCLFISCHMGRRSADVVWLMAGEFLTGSVLYGVARLLVRGDALVTPTVTLSVVAGVLLCRYAYVRRTFSGANVAAPRGEGSVAELSAQNGRDASAGRGEGAMVTGGAADPFRPQGMTFWQLCLFTVVLAASYGVVRTLAANWTGAFDVEALGTFVAAAVVIAVGAARGVRSSLPLLVVTLGVFAVGFVLIPLYLAGVYISSTVLAAGFSMYLIICWGLDAAFVGQGRGAVVVVGATYACVQTGEVVGGVIAMACAPGASIYVCLLSSGLLFCLIGLLIFFFAKQQRPGVGRHEAYLDAVADACAGLSEGGELSAREQEVLLLMAQRKGAGQITRALSISQNTLKTHVRHIYAKLGVHSKDELLDLVDAHVGRW